ncbi:S-locus-specific glycoprotein BS29-1-like [Rutidosis leptorrhynchoides]|uniref:S-locus-specific glycoprotein BS29-1-like n=1 Tax=Rutidosis leptorrhynchoides TaxID=125765 RepID=UPI003A99D7A2
MFTPPYVTYVTMHMACKLILPLIIIISYSQHILTTTNVLTQGASLAVEKGDHLVSPNRLFTAGFHQIGQNAYHFAIWFSELTSDGSRTLVWMANRESLINRKRSEIFLSKTGNLVLSDAGQKIWASNTKSTSPLQLQLLDSGNLVLKQFEVQIQSYLWQSFNFPTNTLLPNQPFTKRRSTFNNTRFALLDSRGEFTSTDNYSFVASDVRILGPKQRK